MMLHPGPGSSTNWLCILLSFTILNSLGIFSLIVVVVLRTPERGQYVSLPLADPPSVDEIIEEKRTVVKDCQEREQGERRVAEKETVAESTPPMGLSDRLMNILMKVIDLKFDPPKNKSTTVADTFPIPPGALDAEMLRTFEMMKQQFFEGSKTNSEKSESGEKSEEVATTAAPPNCTVRLPHLCVELKGTQFCTMAPHLCVEMCECVKEKTKRPKL